MITVSPFAASATSLRRVPSELSSSALCDEVLGRRGVPAEAHRNAAARPVANIPLLKRAFK